MDVNFLNRHKSLTINIIFFSHFLSSFFLVLMFYQSIFPLLLYYHFYAILLIFLDKHKNLLVINLLLTFFPIIKSLLKTKSISITIYNGGSCVFCGFPMLQLPYQFGRSGMDRLNIPLGDRKSVV